MTAPAVLSVWTIYDHPRDYPRHFVARRSEVLMGGGIGTTNDMHTAPTLAEVRALLPPGLYRLPRQLADDPVIVEVWV